MRFLVWGSNITGALDNSADQIIKEPRDVTASLACEEIIWTGWAGVIGQTSTGIRHSGAFDKLDIKLNVKPRRILGFDSAVAYLNADGHICDFTSPVTATTWDDASISGLGTVYTFRKNDGVYISYSLGQAFMPIIHPAFNAKHPARLYSMESRAFLHSAGPMHQLFEIISDDRGKPCPPRLDLIEDLEGMEFQVVAGSCNRLGIVTDAGQAFVLEHRSQEVDLIDAPGDVTMMGLGSDFDVVVVDNVVMVRGNSECAIVPADVDEFGQLGRADTAEFAEVARGTILAVDCARWSTIITMQ